LFQQVAALRTTSVLYTQLCALIDGGPKSLPVAHLSRWDVDQARGVFVATLTDGQALSADVQFIGTHDGRDFKWADSNPSVRADLTICAKQLREGFPADLQVLGHSDTLSISPRDLAVMLGLAAGMCECDMVIAAPSAGTQIAMLLQNAVFTAAAAAPAPKPGLLSRFFAGKPASPPAPDVADKLASLRQTVDVSLNQWQRHLLDITDLRALEPDLMKAHAALQADDARSALDLIERVKARMGPYPQDQEPTGWVYFCEGLAALSCADPARARAAFSVASRAITPPPASVLHLACARAAEPDNRDHALAAAYVLSPEKFLEHATARRSDADPEKVLLHVIEALCQIEVSASERDRDARQTREVAHVTGPADDAARLATNKDYVAFLLTWATPARSPQLGSFTSDPQRHPSRIDAVRPLTRTWDVADFVVTFKGKFPGDLPTIYQYTFRRMALPLGDVALWRLDQIKGDVDRDPYRLF